MRDGQSESRTWRCPAKPLFPQSLKPVVDPNISAKTMPDFRERYLGATDPSNPLASPLFGGFR